MLQIFLKWILEVMQTQKVIICLIAIQASVLYITLENAATTLKCICMQLISKSLLVIML